MIYLCCCTVHFEDSLSITHQRLHKLYIIYQSKIYYIKTLKILLPVSILRSSSGSTYRSLLKLHVKIVNMSLYLSLMWQHIVCLFMRCFQCRGACRSSSCFIFFYLARQPPVGQVIPIHEVSRSHTTTHHKRQDFSGRVISSPQRTLPDKTQHSQETSMPPVGFEPTISAGERLQTYALDRAATGTGCYFITSFVYQATCLLITNELDTPA